MGSIGYFLIGSNDLARARAFYDGLLGSIGWARRRELQRGTLWGAADAPPWFGVITPFDGSPASPGNGATAAFLLDTPEQVDAAHALALTLGGRDEGPAGPRGAGEAFYAGYIRDPDGNKLALIHMFH